MWAARTPVMRVKDVMVYPVKSCCGISCGTKGALVERTGLRYDRQWMVIGEKTGKMITQRKHPALALVKTEIPAEVLCSADPSVLEDQCLTVWAEGNGRAEIPLCEASGRDTPKTKRRAKVWEFETEDAMDEGEEAAMFFSNILNLKARLVRFPRGARRPTEVEFAPQDATHFSDGYPFLVAVQESLDAVNEELSSKGHPSVQMDRFRPNVVILSGAAAFEEDRWAGLATSSGCEFALVKPCSRCTVVSVDPATGERAGREPLSAVKNIHSGKVAGYHRKEWDAAPFFGWNCVVGDESVGRVVSAGEEARATLRVT